MKNSKMFSGLMRVRIWQKQHENMDPPCLISTVQAAGGLMLWWGGGLMPTQQPDRAPLIKKKKCAANKSVASV